MSKAISQVSWFFNCECPLGIHQKRLLLGNGAPVFPSECFRSALLMSDHIHIHLLTKVQAADWGLGELPATNQVTDSPGNPTQHFQRVQTDDTDVPSFQSTYNIHLLCIGHCQDDSNQKICRTWSVLQIFKGEQTLYNGKRYFTLWTRAGSGAWKIRNSFTLGHVVSF